MNVIYFSVKDNIDKRYAKVMHLGTNEMLGDFFTKPLQGKKLQDLRDLILGNMVVGTCAASVGAQ